MHSPQELCFEQIRVRSELLGGGDGQLLDSEQIIQEKRGGTTVHGSFEFVWQLVDDTAGGVWAWAGDLYHSDGNTWTQFTAQDSPFLAGLTALDVAPDGRLWFLTSDGVTVFDGERWIQHRLDGEGWILDRLGEKVEDVTVAADGTVWVVGRRFTGSGGPDHWNRYEPLLYRYHADEWRLFVPQGVEL